MVCGATVTGPSQTPAIVLPSGAARTICVTPMLPPAPPTLTTTTGAPRCGSASLANMRKKPSVPPPAVVGTIRRIGSAARAPPAISEPRARANARAVKEKRGMAVS